MKDFFSKTKANNYENKKELDRLLTEKQKRSDVLSLDNSHSYSIINFDKNIKEKMKNREIILLFGDYDVDGIFSSVMVIEQLKKIANKVVRDEKDPTIMRDFMRNMKIKIPSRKDGYGISKEYVDAMIEQQNVGYIICCDNGTGENMNGVLFNEEKYKDKFFAFDHHYNPEIIRRGLNKNAKHFCNPITENTPAISTGLLVYRFFQKYQTLKPEYNFNEQADLATFTAISDVACLDNNRDILKKGMLMLHNAEVMGLKYRLEMTNILEEAKKDQAKGNLDQTKRIEKVNKLMEKYGSLNIGEIQEIRRPFLSMLLAGNQNEVLNEKEVAFKAVPKINACNRMGGDCSQIVKALLVTQEQINKAKAKMIEEDPNNKYKKTEIEKKLSDILDMLNSQNSLRKQNEQEATKKIIQELEKENMLNNKFILVYKENLNIGLAGLIANKINERTNADVIVAAKVNDEIKFSGRGANVYNNLEIVKSNLNNTSNLHFGGHQVALGGSIKDIDDVFDTIARLNSENRFIENKANPLEKIKTENIILPKPISLFEFGELAKHLTEKTMGVPFSQKFLAPVVLTPSCIENISDVKGKINNQAFVSLRLALDNVNTEERQTYNFITSSAQAKELFENLKKADPHKAEFSSVLMEIPNNFNPSNPLLSGIIAVDKKMTANEFLEKIEQKETIEAEIEEAPTYKI